MSAHLKCGAGRILAISGSTIAYPFPQHSESGQRLLNMICRVEDKRFFYHGGVDIKGVIRAALVNFKHRKVVQGGSTITQQLARTLFLTPHRSLLRKICEVWLAREIERNLSKEEILKAYCESAYLGNGISGFEAASRFIFRKRINSLNEAEIASLVPLLRAPSRNNPVCGQERFVNLARQAQRSLGVPHHDLRPINPIRNTTFRSPRLEKIVFQEIAALGIEVADVESVTTTLNRSLQRIVDQVLRHETQTNAEVESIAAVFLCNVTGDVIAESSWAGGGATVHSPGFHGNIQPGSTFKTFGLISALEQGYSLDLPVESAPFATGESNGRNWKVRNYRDQYSGTVTLADALIRSDNSAFARLVMQLDQQLVASVYERFNLCNADQYTPAAVLGGINRGISLVQLAAAYGAIERCGVLLTPRIVKHVGFRDGTSAFFKQSQSIKVLDYEVARHIDALLARCKVGMSSSAFKGKTGTTRKGSIFAGYNEKMSTAIWVNYKRPQDEHDDKGVTARTLLDKIGDALLGHRETRLLEII